MGKLKNKCIKNDQRKSAFISGENEIVSHVALDKVKWKFGKWVNG